jgi:hypothetical protein
MKTVFGHHGKFIDRYYGTRYYARYYGTDLLLTTILNKPGAGKQELFYRKVAKERKDGNLAKRPPPVLLFFT